MFPKVLRAENPKSDTPEFLEWTRAHRLNGETSEEKEPNLRGTFYDDQDHIMHHAMIQDEHTPQGRFYNSCY